MYGKLTFYPLLAPSDRSHRFLSDICSHLTTVFAEKTFTMELGPNIKIFYVGFISSNSLYCVFQIISLSLVEQCVRVARPDTVRLMEFITG